MHLFLLDASVIFHLIANRIDRYSLRGDYREIYIKASLFWVQALGFVPHYRGADNCHALWLLDIRNDGHYWRHQLEPEYKGNRPEKGGSFLHVREQFSALDIPSIGFPGYEADDIAGVLCRMHKAQMMPDWEYCHLITTDSDWLALVRDGIDFMECGGRSPLIRDADIAYEWLSRKWEKQSKKKQKLWPIPSKDEFRCRHIWDWKSVVGDTSDRLGPGTDLGIISLYQPTREYDLFMQPGAIAQCKAAIKGAIAHQPNSHNEMLQTIQALGVEPPIGYIS